MKKISLYTHISLVIKKVTGVKDLTLLSKRLHKKIGQLLFHKRYNTHDIIGVMKDMGMKKGSVVCIHASMMEFYNYTGSAEELISCIMEVITESGTLIMPAYPKAEFITDKDFVFDSTKEPTCAGYLAETFRKWPNVCRSTNTQHSVCAWGKYAEWLTKDHNQCINCWDENSPWYRMTELDAIVFALGLPGYYIGTFTHCVEGLLWKEHPYWQQFFNEERTFKYLDSKDNAVKEYTCMFSSIEKRTREQRLLKEFGSYYNKYRLSNLLIKSFNSKECLRIMIECGRKGKTIYYVPSPAKYTF